MTASGEPAMNEVRRTLKRTSTHWGAFDAEVEDGKIVAFHPIPEDPDPSPIGQSMAGAVDHPLRIREPMVRKGWLEHGPGPAGGRRGAEPFVALPWDEALDLAARELERVRKAHGNQAIFGGSYGWSSAGRFHFAQGQVHRFLNTIGGYTKSVNTYSLAAGEVIINRVLGGYRGVISEHTAWPVIEKHTRLFVTFGGIPLKNAQVDHGGFGRHDLTGWLKRWRAAGIEFVNIGPVRRDADQALAAEWLPIRPNTDVALMLGLAHTLIDEDIHDRAFLDRYCEGFARFRPYVMGEVDGTAKSADWAATITGIPAETIRALARRMANNRTMISVAWSLQRADHGEQTFWMATTLAAMLGQIGLPGGGVGFGYGAVQSMGTPSKRPPVPTLPQGPNPIDAFIPVARIADMLLNPGAEIDYDGSKVTFPDIRLVYWCGGNPFHHHQDLNRLVKAWQRPDTVIAHEPWWNPLARHADIVFPATTTFERNDIGGSSDNFVLPMQKVVEPVGGARNDYDIFAGLAERMGVRDAFTEGRDEAAWLRYMYNQFRQRAARDKIDAPEFDRFWRSPHFEYPGSQADHVLLADFRADPVKHRLQTPSGKIEIYSERIASFGYDDCPGHPTWLEPFEWLGAPGAKRYPLHMISNQPKTRLHSQYDHGAYAQASKIKGREPVLINPKDAAARGIANGDVIRVYNDRGAALAGAVVTDDVMAGVIQFQTGAWYDPAEPGVPGSLDRHGNPNTLTRDRGTSKLAQGPSAQSALVQVERHTGPLPEVGVAKPPAIERRR
jgi:biotin/methionine sulfoxide reductase